jgi:hypothetical protein
MYVEMRLYNTLAINTRKYVALYQEEGLPIQQPIQGNLLGLFVHEFGPMEQVVLMWGYDSLEDRDRRRAILDGDERWKGFMAKVVPLVVSHESRLLRRVAP